MSTTYRIAVGGWQHETNTFADIKADYASFVQADEWPAMASGDDMLTTIDGVHLPITGALEVLTSQGAEICPLLWCSATPSSYVTEQAFEKISAQMLEQLGSYSNLDGIYLDLHGAMVCEHVEDGEGELLRRIRQQFNDIAIAISLDLHANVTPAMLEYADSIDIFRTYPHIDMGESGARAAKSLLAMLNKGRKPAKAFRQVDFLIPLNWGCTLIEPAQGIYQHLEQLIDEHCQEISFACGFHLSDIYHVGPSVMAYAEEQATAQAKVDALHDFIMTKRDAFAGKIWTLPELAPMLKDKLASKPSKPLVLADTQDNPGGGGAGDSIGLLATMIQSAIPNMLFGALCDPQVAALAHQHGEGGEFIAPLGAVSGYGGEQPLEARNIRVLALSDGCFTATGPMYLGARMEVGNAALLDVSGVTVLVVSKPVQTADQAMFKHIGTALSSFSVIALKSSVHFRNDFTDLAEDILVVAAPGAVFADPQHLQYKNSRLAIL